MKTYTIALMPGDGIGHDVTDAAWAVLERPRPRARALP